MELRHLQCVVVVLANASCCATELYNTIITVDILQTTLCKNIAQAQSGYTLYPGRMPKLHLQGLSATKPTQLLAPLLQCSWWSMESEMKVYSTVEYDWYFYPKMAFQMPSCSGNFPCIAACIVCHNRVCFCSTWLRHLLWKFLGD